MSKTYYIFRHGETFATLKNSGYGLRRFTAGIIESGKPAIERLAEHLKTIPTDLNVTSPIARCQQTAKIVTLITGKKFIVDWRVTEFFEPFPLLRRRLKRFLNQCESSNFETILVCTHGACIAGLVSLLTTGDYKASELLDYPPPGILIKVKDGKIEEYDFNQ